MPLNLKTIARLAEDVNAGRITNLDGSRSPLGVRIRDFWRGGEFEMDDNWVLLPQDWRCPCCLRSKFEITRIGRAGQILAKIVSHHDHMRSAPEHEFYAAFKGDRSSAEYKRGYDLVMRLHDHFCAFDDVLVCEDCNNADSKAAKEVSAPENFSFSVEQMRQFLKPTAHRRHDLDQEKLRSVWASAQVVHERRVNLMNALVAGAVRGHVSFSNEILNEHDARAWYAKSPQLNGFARPTPPAYWREAEDGEFSSSEAMTAICRALNVPTERKLARWRTVPPAVVRVPSPEAIQACLAREAKRPRKLLHADWHCPICGRAKVSTMFVEKDGDTRFGTAEYWRPNSPPPPIRVCLHCMNTLNAIKNELAVRTGRTMREVGDLIPTEKLREMIIPREHGAHRIRADIAEKFTDETIAASASTGTGVPK